jgi:dihydrofolate reductase
MRKIIEYTMASVDGVFTAPEILQFGQYDNDAYNSDGLGQLCACDAVLLGRTTYEQFANLWPGRDHPWTDRLNAIKKYVFSSTLQHADWENSVIVRGNVDAEVTRLKQQDGGDMIVYGHGQLSQTLLKAQLLDVLDLAIHPVLAGSGGALIHQQLTASMELVAAKTFSNIVKLSYEPQYR